MTTATLEEAGFTNDVSARCHRRSSSPPEHEPAVTGRVITFDADTLQGSEVALRPLRIDDATALTAAAAESREQYGFTTVPDGSDEVQQYLDKAFRLQREGTRLAFTILWRDRVVGTTSFFEIQQWEWRPGSPHFRAGMPDAAEIGYTWLAASAQRTRVNSEAKFLLLQYAFENWRVQRLCLRTDVRNKRSWQAIERLGARFEGIRRADMPARDGGVRDSAFFSIVPAEWPTVKARLLAKLSSYNSPVAATNDFSGDYTPKEQL